MSRKKRMQNLREAKDRRAKKLAVGGAVVLVAVLAFEVPHMLGGGSKTSAPASTTATPTGGPAASTTAAPAATPTATPAGTALAAAAPTTASTKLPNSDVAPKRAKSQLYSFSNFSGKDPFVQQISSGTQLQTPTSSPSTSAPPPTPAQTASVTSRSGQQGSSKPQSVRTLAKAGAATIAVNGRRETVQIGAGFPSSNPLFKLVSVSHGVVKIGIASGSYASGAQTVSLVTGRTLTLVDTADGIHYKLRLLAAA
jgi:hypothetical protein